ncbi:nuclear pore protein [Colletotrichum tofieldiae]|nr:nuclear pore protein [Colletotrichum tofieldiae]
MEFKNLAIRTSADVVDDYDSDIDSEWIQTPSDDTLADADEIQIDPNGDLLLHTGPDSSSGDTKLFRVCSNTIRRSSPFWKRSLYETSSEIRAHDGEWWACTPSLYACQYEKSSGLIILLNIIHSNFNQIPSEPTLTEIYNILCLASSFEMELVLQPWIAQWHGILKSAETSRSGHDLGMLACMAWTLGDERLFTRTTMKITLTCVADKEGHMITADGVRLDDYIYDSLGSPTISGKHIYMTFITRLDLKLPQRRSAHYGVK